MNLVSRRMSQQLFALGDFGKVDSIEYVREPKYGFNVVYFAGCEKGIDPTFPHVPYSLTNLCYLASFDMPHTHQFAPYPPT